MSKLWDTYKFLLDPDTPPEEADKVCRELTQMAAEGDEEVERVVAALGMHFLGRSTMPPSLMEYLSMALLFRAKGHKWEHAFRHKKHKVSLIPPKEMKILRRYLDEHLIVELVELARSIGLPLRATPGEQPTAFEFANENAKKIWLEETGRLRGKSGMVSTPDNALRTYYRRRHRLTPTQ